MIADQIKLAVLSLEAFCIVLVDRLPLTYQEISENGKPSKRAIAAPRAALELEVECDLNVLHDFDARSIRGCATEVQTLLRALTKSNDASGGGDDSASDYHSRSPLQECLTIVNSFPKTLVTRQAAQEDGPLSVAESEEKSDVETWLTHLWHPSLDNYDTSVPLVPCLIALVCRVTELSLAISDRLGLLEGKVKHRTARTGQRKQYISTLLAGPAISHMLLSTLRIIEFHVNASLVGEQGIQEDRLSRLLREIESFARIGDTDNDRKGYEQGLRDIATYLRTRAARELFHSCFG